MSITFHDVNRPSRPRPTRSIIGKNSNVSAVYDSAERPSRRASGTRRDGSNRLPQARNIRECAPRRGRQAPPCGPR